ncbi:hypothetical protein, partial [Brucella endophytica]
MHRKLITTLLASAALSIGFGGAAMAQDHAIHRDQIRGRTVQANLSSNPPVDPHATPTGNGGNHGDNGTQPHKGNPPVNPHST